MRQRRFSNLGFTMIEGLVAIAVGSLLLLTVGSMLIDLNRSQVQLERKASSIGLVNELRLFLSNRINCASALSDQVLNLGAADGLAESVPVRVRYNGQDIRSDLNLDRYNIFLDTVALRNILLVSNGTGGIRNFMVDLELAVREQSGAVRPQKASRLYLSMNSANQVVSCFGVDNSLTAQQACTAIGGQVNPVTGACSLVLPLCTASRGNYNGNTDTCDLAGPLCQRFGGTPGAGGTCQWITVLPQIVNYVGPTIDARRISCPSNFAFLWNAQAACDAYIAPFNGGGMIVDGNTTTTTCGAAFGADSSAY